jgi:NADH-quinone oxidoreductase subunit J
MLFSLEIEFLAFILMLIYVGAISVLFLFIIMMLKLNKEEIHKDLYFVLSSKYYIYILFLSKIILFLFYFNKKLSLSLDSFSYEFLKYNNDLNIFSTKLFQIENDISIFFNVFTQKYFFFIIIGFILLFSMVGSISLCLKKKS